MSTVDNIYIPIYLSKDIIYTLSCLKENTKGTHLNIMGVYCPLVESESELNFVNDISKLFNITIINIETFRGFKHNDLEVFEKFSYLYYSHKLYEQLKFLRNWSITNNKKFLIE